MNEYVITPLSDLIGIANNIRNKTNTTTQFEIAELQNHIDTVYEAGQYSEEKRFWEIFQNGGRRTEYRNAFYSWLWKDSIYNPLYPIMCSSNSSEMFRYNSSITDTKVDINFSYANSNYVFANATSLKTIKKLIVVDTVNFTNWFAGCTALENITFEGVIGQNIDFSPCTLLTYESLMSIITHLKDFSGTSTTRTLSIGADNLAKLSNAEKAMATEKGWSLA